MDSKITKLSLKIHEGFIYNYRAKSLTKYVNQLLPKNQSLLGLDVGCGNGEISHNLTILKPEIKIQGAEINISENNFIKVTKFDGKKLPFADNEFDFILLVDVLHHINDFNELLNECTRVASNFILIKDHIAETRWDLFRLRVMDWIGNYFQNVPLPYNYLSNSEWEQLFKNKNLNKQQMIKQLKIYPRICDFLFNKNIHFVARLKLDNN
ncbi:methyltransferase domain-containing protein [Candidatus Kuenenbacteria bacterium]|nr:methyltransferase domain-containing protein [Candidatus Kuenenbacteria bacterium]